jgi:hypothetical protein
MTLTSIGNRAVCPSFMLVEAEFRVDFCIAIWSAILHAVSGIVPKWICSLWSIIDTCL